jgi:Bifunctional DNA primase/polymerase, N-terminal/AAA domain
VSAQRLLETALRCVEKGWYVFPLGEKSKVPDGELAPNGFNSASNDPAVVREWWTKKPNANPGIDLGRSNLTVLDFDNGAPPPELGLPNTLQVSTSRGTHVYLSGVSKQGNMNVNGVHVGEIKSAGGYVLAPFSVHPSGSVYSVAVTAPVASIPDGLIDRLRPERKSVNATPNGEKIPYGQHDTELHRIAGKLRGIGMEEESIYDALVEICEKRCEGYGSDYLQMCRKHAHNICQKPVNENRDIALTQNTATPVDVSDWRDQFRSVGEMDDGPIVEVIHGVLQEGICFLGASPSDGKTLVSLAMAKSICTGEPLFGLPQFAVMEPRTVIYLIPESRDRAFRKRCEAFRIPNDKTKFMARTVSLGPTLQLDDPILLQAVKDTNAVVFLDTAVRFMKGADENSAAQNRLLVNDVINLLANGAVCVVLAHHATKASPNEPMTQENMLRGTSDFAAMCDQIYGIRKDRNLYDNGEGPMELDLVNLKDREQIGELTKIRLAASSRQSKSEAPTSVINSTGNFRVVDKDMNRQRSITDLLSIVKGDVLITLKELARKTAMSEYEVDSQLRSAGWHRVKGGKEGASPWHQDIELECPYGKPISMSKVLQIDRPRKPTMKDAILLLRDMLAGTSETRTVSVERVLEEAGRKGITDTQVKDARRELGAKKGEDGGLYLPIKSQEPGEPTTASQPPASEGF